MTFIYSQTNTATVLEVISRAKECELSRDLELQGEILKEIWSDFDAYPDVAGYAPEIKAELFRVCGFFLSHYGRAKNISSYQERGKNYLTGAIEIFEKHNLIDKAAESKCQLSMCYWREGSSAEAEAVLDEAESAFSGNEFHKSYLLIQINRLIVMHWSKDYASALPLIEKIRRPMEFVEDPNLLSMYHNHVGMIFNCLDDFQKAAFHLQEALRFARQANNRRFTAKFLNNLAFTFKQTGEFKKAENFVNESVEIFSTLNDSGWIANVLDTKAGILLAQGKPEEALKIIARSIELLETSGDAISLIESLWTQTEVYLALKNISGALVSFNRLTNLAISQVGEFAVKKYVEQFEKSIYIRGNSGFDVESDNFRRSMIESALASGIDSAAEKLKLEKDDFENILVDEFPDIARREGVAKRVFGVEQIEPLTTDASLFLKGKEIFAEAYLFIIPENKSNFGRDVVVCALADVGEGLQVIEYDDEIFISQLHFDEFSGFYSIDDFPVPMNAGDVFVIGGVVGICELSDVNTDFINFTPI